MAVSLEWENIGAYETPPSTLEDPANLLPSLLSAAYWHGFSNVLMLDSHSDFSFAIMFVNGSPNSRNYNSFRNDSYDRSNFGKSMRAPFTNSATGLEMLER